MSDLTGPLPAGHVYVPVDDCGDGYGGFATLSEALTELDRLNLRPIGGQVVIRPGTVNNGHDEEDE